MEIFLALVMLWFFPNQACEVKVMKHVENLSSEEWQVREQASLELKKLADCDMMPVDYIYRHYTKSPEPECRRRCSKLYEMSIRIVSDSKRTAIPSIWALENSVRFPLGFQGAYDYAETPTVYKYESLFDLGKFYYEKAREEVMTYDKEMNRHVWTHDATEILATKMLISDLRRAGWSRRNCEKLLNNMIEDGLSSRFATNYNSDDNDEKIPKPFQ